MLTGEHNPANIAGYAADEQGHVDDLLTSAESRTLHSATDGDGEEVPIQRAREGLEACAQPRTHL